MEEKWEQPVRVALEAGKILLESGAEIRRVEETVHRILRAFRVEEGEIFVLSNGLFFTLEVGQGKTCARVKHIPIIGVSLDRVVAVNELSRQIESGLCGCEEAEARIHSIREMERLSLGTGMLAALLGSGAFCFLFGGSIPDSAVAGLSGMLMYAVILLLGRKRPQISKILINLAGGMLALLLDICFLKAGLGKHLEMIITGSIMPLIPGVPVVLSVRDVTDGDYISGMVRFLDAVLITVGISMGVSCGYYVIRQLGIPLAMLPSEPLSGGILPAGLAAWIGTVAFSVMFSVPSKYYGWCGGIGAAGWMLYRLLMAADGGQLMFSAFLAAILVVGASRAAAVLLRCPVTVFLLPGIFPLVPGVSIYRTIYAYVSGNSLQFSMSGRETAEYAVAIVLAILLVFEIPQRWIGRLRGKGYTS